MENRMTQESPFSPANAPGSGGFLADAVNSHVPPAIDRAKPFLVWGLFLLIACVAFSLRMYKIDAEAAWLDEIVSVKHLDEPTLLGYLKAERADDPPMTPLYFSVQYGWAALFGSDVTTVRYLSVAFAMLTLAGLFAVAKRLYGSYAALIAAFFFAMAPMHLRYGQEIRMYGLAWLLAVLSIYTLILAIQTPCKRWWILHFATNCALVWTHLFTVFLLPAEGLVVLYVFRGILKKVYLWYGVNLALVLPLLAWVIAMDHERLGQFSDWLSGATPFTVGMMAEYFSGGAYFVRHGAVSEFVSGLRSWQANDLIRFQLIAVIFLSIVTVFRQRLPSGKMPLSPAACYLVVVLWAFLPPILLALLSIWRPSFWYRYVGYSALPLYIMLGAALAAVPRPKLRTAFTSVAVLWLLMQTYVDVQSRPYRIDWETTTTRMQRQNPDIPIFTNNELSKTALDFYLEEPHPPIIVCNELDDMQEALTDNNSAFFPCWVIIDPTFNYYADPFHTWLGTSNVAFNVRRLQVHPAPLFVYEIESQGSNVRAPYDGPKPSAPAMKE